MYCHLIHILEFFKGKMWLGLVVSARFTAWSIFCEMVSGNRLVGRDFQIIILQNNYSGPNSKGGPNFREFMISLNCSKN